MFNVPLITLESWVSPYQWGWRNRPPLLPLVLFCVCVLWCTRLLSVRRPSGGLPWALAIGGIVYWYTYHGMGGSLPFLGVRPPPGRPTQSHMLLTG